ncbi:MAG: replication initiation protein [Desulfobacteraceae bacterium]|nr:replication initiation protein [Desulfobacteraceae bacterium]
MAKAKASKELITKSNKLIEAHYKLTTQEQKLILMVVSMVKPTDKDFHEYIVPVATYKKIMKIKSKAYHTRLRQSAKTLLGKVLTIPRGEKDWLLVNWFSHVELYHEAGCIGVSFDPKLRPYLLQLKANFTRFALTNVIQLSSAYAIRLYELLKQYEHSDTMRREFLFEDLKKILGCEDLYKLYGHFNERVLKPAKKELYEKTDISFTYKVRKIGRRVNWIIFVIIPKNKPKNKNGKNKAGAQQEKYSASNISKSILEWLPAAYRTNQDVLRDITTYAEIHGHNYVIQKIAYTVKQNPNKFAPYFGNSLKNNWGADHNPFQDKQLLDKKASALPKVKQGMRVRFEGHEYTVEDGPAIYPKSGGVPNPAPWAAPTIDKCRLLTNY